MNSNFQKSWTIRPAIWWVVRCCNENLRLQEYRSYQESRQHTGLTVSSAKDAATMPREASAEPQVSTTLGVPVFPRDSVTAARTKKKKKLSDHQARRIGDEIPPLTRPSTSVVMTLRGGQPGLSSLLVRGILAGFPSPRPAAATEIWSHSAVVTQNENRGGGRRRRGGGQGQGGERQTVCGNRALLGLWRGLAGEDDDVVKAPLHSAQHLTQQLAAVASSFYMAKWVETHERGGPMDQLREHYCQKSCPYKSIIQNRRKSHKKIYQWKNDV